MNQAGGGIPTSAGIQNHQQEITAILRDFSDKATSGLRGKTRLNTLNTGNPPEKTIRRMKQIRTRAIDRHNHGPFFPHKFTKDRLLECDHAQSREIFRRRIMVRAIKSASVTEVRIAQA